MAEREKYVLFVFTTNDLQRLDRELRDRCRIVHIGCPQPERWLARAKTILKAENVPCPSDATRLLDFEEGCSVIGTSLRVRRMSAMGRMQTG